MLGTWIDLIATILIVIYFLVGLGRGFWHVSVSFAAFAGGFGLAVLGYAFSASVLAGWFEVTPQIAKVIGFGINFLIFKYLFFFILQYGAEKFLAGRAAGAQSLVRQAAGGLVGALYALTSMVLLLSIFLSMSLPPLARDEIKRANVGKVSDWMVEHNGGHLDDIFGGTWKEVSLALQTLTVQQSGENEKTDLPFKILDPKPRADLETAMLQKINAERTARGLKPLKMHQGARRVAREYGTYLFAQGIFSHIDAEGRGPAERMKAAGVDYAMVGENLALNSTLEGAHEGLMNSKGHRDNILYPFFSGVGIGVIDGGDYGMIFVQEFLD